MAATRTREGALAHRYRRLHARRGHRRAVVGVSHALLVIGWQLERPGAHYAEPAPRVLDARQRRRQRSRALTQLKRLGYHVELTEAP